jgi:hypothetical protein
VDQKEGRTPVLPIVGQHLAVRDVLDPLLGDGGHDLESTLAARAVARGRWPR